MAPTRPILINVLNHLLVKPFSMTRFRFGFLLSVVALSPCGCIKSSSSSGTQPAKAAQAVEQETESDRLFNDIALPEQALELKIKSSHLPRLVIWSISRRPVVSTLCTTPENVAISLCLKPWAVVGHHRLRLGWKARPLLLPRRPL